MATKKKTKMSALLVGDYVLTDDATICATGDTLKSLENNLLSQRDEWCYLSDMETCTVMQVVDASFVIQPEKVSIVISKQKSK